MAPPPAMTRSQQAAGEAHKQIIGLHRLLYAISTDREIRYMNLPDSRLAMIEHLVNMRMVSPTTLAGKGHLTPAGQSVLLASAADGPCAARSRSSILCYLAISTKAQAFSPKTGGRQVRVQTQSQQYALRWLIQHGHAQDDPNQADYDYHCRPGPVPTIATAQGRLWMDAWLSADDLERFHELDTLTDLRNERA